MGKILGLASKNEAIAQLILNPDLCYNDTETYIIYFDDEEGEMAHLEVKGGNEKRNASN